MIHINTGIHLLAASLLFSLFIMVLFIDISNKLAIAHHIIGDITHQPLTFSISIQFTIQVQLDAIHAHTSHQIIE
jgi:hypothetical protein